MIIGNGDVAQVLKEIDIPDLLFFASGVSNSAEERESEYKREIAMLMAQDKTKHIVYFSSLSIFLDNGRYQRHKMLMERLIKKNFRHYTIVRLGNITWGDNPRTIINFLKRRIVNNEPFEIKDVYRHLIDQHDFKYWMMKIPSWNVEMNLIGQMLKVKDIVDLIKKGKL